MQQKQYSNLIKTKTVHSSAFPALLLKSTVLIWSKNLGYDGNWPYAEATMANVDF